MTAHNEKPNEQNSLSTSISATSMRCDGAKVARIRESMELTQQEVAYRANLSYSAVVRIERGLLVFAPTVQEVALVLGISLADMRHPNDLEQ